MNCRPGCGACCIAPSISSPIPGMPSGKPAGVRCLHLSDVNLCGLFGNPARPAVCAEFQADVMFCGDDRQDAIRLLGWLEQATGSSNEQHVV
ncbi:YkgJ family cysteine cluster protein [Stutzerimonas zhaodongensis]|uniref:YkgJ family cysteine cluster protein n=1 Tax=Stutzerimonas zhaodongensis TaxID=1176257 RepID=UPI002108005C|nr:YkgJ family cysteine cluster protein [Stutzerimonas zhaodongensis]MCQ2031803.1 YkgJ family cysteine cluster protein [Stutzerimonas zhaodongensis]